MTTLCFIEFTNDMALYCVSVGCCLFLLWQAVRSLLDG